MGKYSTAGGILCRAMITYLEQTIIHGRSAMNVLYPFLAALI